MTWARTVIYMIGITADLNLILEGVARRSLAALSHVCRAFKNIALDVLSVELENFKPLIIVAGDL